MAASRTVEHTQALHLGWSQASQSSALPCQGHAKDVVGRMSPINLTSYSPPRFCPAPANGGVSQYQVSGLYPSQSCSSQWSRLRSASNLFLQTVTDCLRTTLPYLKVLVRSYTIFQTRLGQGQRIRRVNWESGSPSLHLSSIECVSVEL